MTRIHSTALAGVLIIEPPVHGDSRGFFLESYRRDAWVAAGVDADFVQDNHSRSVRGTLRGLHFQSRPGQAKLVRVAHGTILDVVVDLRRTSPTFGDHITVQLDDVRHRQVYVPVGFAHGFCVTSDVADVAYKVDSYYDPDTELGLAWDDPVLGISWPIADPIVSARDAENPTLGELRDRLPDW